MEKEKEVDFRRFPKTDLYHYLIDLLFEYPQNNERVIEVIKRIIEINHEIRDDKYCRILENDFLKIIIENINDKENSFNILDKVNLILTKALITEMFYSRFDGPMIIPKLINKF